MSLLPLLAMLTSVSVQTSERPRLVIVLGAPGTPGYASEFRAWADQWKAASSRGGAESIEIGTGANPPGSTDRDRLKAVLDERTTRAAGEALWIILIGHGTFDGREAKFNLRGPDVSDQELAKWLQPAKRP